MNDIIQIRKALAEDLPDILNLVKELAAFEKEPDAVSCTIDEYLSCFQDNIFKCLVAENEQEILGIGLYYFGFSTWKGKILFLEDFVVKQNTRSNGIGTKLFDQLIREARQTDCVMIKWQVLDWNTRAQNFYSKYNALIEKNWWNGKLFL